MKAAGLYVIFALIYQSTRRQIPEGYNAGTDTYISIKRAMYILILESIREFRSRKSGK